MPESIQTPSDTKKVFNFGDPATDIGLVNAAIALIEQLVPKIQGLFKSGAVTVEEQQLLMTRVTSLLNDIDSGAAFQGPEWQQSQSQPPPTS